MTANRTYENVHVVFFIKLERFLYGDVRFCLAVFHEKFHTVLVFALGERQFEPFVEQRPTDREDSRQVRKVSYADLWLCGTCMKKWSGNARGQGSTAYSNGLDEIPSADEPFCFFRAMIFAHRLP